MDDRLFIPSQSVYILFPFLTILTGTLISFKFKLRDSMVIFENTVLRGIPL